jgi:cobalt/nickel transport system permease protein
MHLPDTFLSLPVSLAAATMAAGGLGLALRRAGRHVSPRRVPLMGLAAAFIFAAQMINFPLPLGTSGHLIGGVLAAVLLGPSPAVVVLAAVLIVQCFMFSDGGILALGANILNLALIAPLAGYAIYFPVRRAFTGLRGQILAAAFAAWCSTVLASICCAGEIAASGHAPWSKILPFMAAVHMVIGLGEALITALVLVAIARTRPELLENHAASPPHHPSLLAYGLLLSLALAIFVSPLASTWPDGLEKVAATLGFSHLTQRPAPVASPMPDYRVPGVSVPSLATALAGAAGTCIVFVLAYLLSRILVPKRPTTPTPGE